MAGEVIMGRPLDDADVSSAAKRLGVTEAQLRAVITVESSGDGFLDSRENGSRLPKILFEAHVFSRQTGGRFDADHPRLSSAHWDRTLYAGGAAEYDRLRQAADLDFTAAYRSSSWGLFQIMGFNHEAAGYDQLLDFIGAQYVSESLQLQCGVNFILAHGLERYLRSQDWAGFAKGYNGPAYQENHYDEKLADAFARFTAKATASGGGIEDVQRALKRAGFDVAVDGVLGPKTKDAIRQFQQRQGLTVDGVAGPKTRAALGLA